MSKTRTDLRQILRRMLSGQWSIIVLFLVSVTSAYPQERLSIFGHFGSNISSITIDEFTSDDVFCGTFRSGSAGGTGFGLGWEKPINDSRFSFIGQAAYLDLSSRFQTQPFQIENARDLTTSDLIRIERERVYATSVGGVFLAPLIGWRPIERIRFDAGAMIGYIVRHSFTKTEVLLRDDVVYSSNSLSELPLESGTFEANLFQVMLKLGAQYEMPLSDRMDVAPNVRASFPITTLTNSSGYRTWNISGGISLSYKFLPEPDVIPLPVKEEPKEEPKEEADKPVVVAPVEVEKSILRVNVRAVGFTTTGEEVAEPVVAIDNIRVTDVSPTLNYIFFDDGKSEIASRYSRLTTASQTKDYSMSSLYHLDALGLHHELLNILGKRLQDNPSTRITLTGTRSNRSNGDSLSETNLALQRAAAVGKYLEEVWNIEPSRMRLRSRGLPEQSSDETSEAGQQENRRVEISSNDAAVLDPIVTKRIERTATPPSIAFYPSIVANSGIASITYTIKQGETVLLVQDGLSSEAESEWHWNINAESIINGRDSVTWTADVIDSTGNTATVGGVIHVHRSEQTQDLLKRDTVVNKTLERFHLLLFDYSSAATKNSEGVDKLLERITTSIRPDSRITLIGHTDKTGDPLYNERLSLERATTASMLLSTKLRKYGIATPQFAIEGRGAKELLFDNTEAEGRFLSRTVRISIERDVKQ